MANAEAALVQRVNGTVCPFGVERYRHQEAIPHFVHETRPGSHMLWGWLPNAQPLGLQKRSAPAHPRARSRAAPAPAAGGGEGWEGLLLLRVWVSAEQAAGQALAGMRGRLHSGAGLLRPGPGCRL